MRYFKLNTFDFIQDQLKHMGVASTHTRIDYKVVSYINQITKEAYLEGRRAGDFMVYVDLNSQEDIKANSLFISAIRTFREGLKQERIKTYIKKI